MSKNSEQVRDGNFKTIRLILGDQLNLQHSWFQQVEPTVLYVVAELHQETCYVTHHVQKICAFFAAMRDFADELKRNQHQVLYLTLDETANTPSLTQLINRLLDKYQAEEFEYQRPDEYRLLKQLREMQTADKVSVTEADTEHFLLPFHEIENYFQTKKHVRMETFYRKMRKRFGILMDDAEPEGGRWNFDAENR
ncbi:MAG: cryptochrome/photolyase family protein, partial [Pseudomonadales bacterium]|nr:cryptochrome/photolyase family protein [Pseudomonadales bacterium]